MNALLLIDPNDVQAPGDRDNLIYEFNFLLLFILLFSVCVVLFLLNNYLKRKRLINKSDE